MGRAGTVGHAGGSVVRYAGESVARYVGRSGLAPLEVRLAGESGQGTVMGARPLGCTSVPISGIAGVDAASRRCADESP